MNAILWTQKKKYCWLLLFIFKVSTVFTSNLLSICLHFFYFFEKFTHIYVCIYICICVYICVCMYVYTYIHRYVYMCICVYIYIYTDLVYFWIWIPIIENYILLRLMTLLHGLNLDRIWIWEIKSKPYLNILGLGWIWIKPDSLTYPLIDFICGFFSRYNFNFSFTNSI